MSAAPPLPGPIPVWSPFDGLSDSVKVAAARMRCPVILHDGRTARLTCWFPHRPHKGKARVMFSSGRSATVTTVVGVDLAALAKELTS